jgi:hypothetical protein
MRLIVAENPRLRHSPSSNRLNETTGSGNTAIGGQALQNSTIGSFNIALGYQAGLGATTGSSNIYIGAGVFGNPDDNGACYIGNIFGRTSINGSRFSLTQLISSAQPHPQSALRKISSQWTNPAKCSWDSNRLPSGTKRKSIQQAHHSWAL